MTRAEKIELLTERLAAVRSQELFASLGYRVPVDRDAIKRDLEASSDEALAALYAREAFAFGFTFKTEKPKHFGFVY